MFFHSATVRPAATFQGMSSGISDASDVVVNSASAGRIQYTGSSLVRARTVSDAGAGGMVLMNESTFKQVGVHVGGGKGAWHRHVNKSAWRVEVGVVYKYGAVHGHGGMHESTMLTNFSHIRCSDRARAWALRL